MREVTLIQRNWTIHPLSKLASQWKPHRMKCEDILKCHQDIEYCLHDMAASFAAHGLAGSVTIEPGHAIQIALYPEDDDPNIICCQTIVRHRDAAYGFSDVEVEAIAVAMCDRVEKSVSAILRRSGFDVSDLVMICEPRRVESF